MARMTKRERTEMRLPSKQVSWEATGCMLRRCLDELDAREGEPYAGRSELEKEIGNLKAENATLRTEVERLSHFESCPPAVKNRPDKPGTWWAEDRELPDVVTEWTLTAIGNSSGRWIKIEKPVFPPAVDPVAEKAKELANLFYSEGDWVIGGLVKAYAENLKGWTPPSTSVPTAP